MKNAVLLFLVLSLGACSPSGGGGSSSSSQISSSASSAEKMKEIKEQALASGHSLSLQEIDYLKKEGLVTDEEYQELLELAQK